MNRGLSPPDWSKDDHPAIDVSWNDATAFCAFIRGRLPTEAEWEYAARGGAADGIYPWGDAEHSDRANGSGVAGRDRWEHTAPVGSFPPNRYGLFDMAGNVWEWTSTVYRENPFRAGPGAEDAASRKARAVRGGSWSSPPGVYGPRSGSMSCRPTDSSTSVFAVRGTGPCKCDVQAVFSVSTTRPERRGGPARGPARRRWAYSSGTGRGCTRSPRLRARSFSSVRTRCMNGISGSTAMKEIAMIQKLSM